MSFIGVDEVGRGCLAGDMLVVAARPHSKLPLGLKDSKLLTKTQREYFFKKIANACDIGEGWVTATEIDSLGLTRATRLGVSRSLAMIQARTDEKIVVDGHINYAPKEFYNSQAIIRADGSIAEVAAASIYAKVKRDAYMKDISLKYQGYGFEKNMGYGTKLHLEALKILGSIDSVHRVSFSSIRNLVN
jgi:ribonuclease HII